MRPSASRNFHCAARADFRVAAAGFAPGVLDVDGFLSLTQSYFYYMYEYLKGEGQPGLVSARCRRWGQSRAVVLRVSPPRRRGVVARIRRLLVIGLGGARRVVECAPRQVVIGPTVATAIGAIIDD